MSLPTVAECLRRAPLLTPVSDSARLDLEVLLAHVLDKTRTYLYTWPEAVLSASQSQHFEQLLAARLKGQPLAYLTGVQEFWSLPFFTSPHTLIPRADTELLVELALELLPQTSQKLLDLGTGTGAIALALAHERRNWTITGVDKTAEVIQLAERNRKNLALANAAFKMSDWFGALSNDRFDLIVSNPPYIASDDKHLECGDVRFEPRSALVAADNGLADIAYIARCAKNYLVPGGYLLFEHGWQQAEPVQTLLRQAGFTALQTRLDLSGHRRATWGVKGCL